MLKFLLMFDTSFAKFCQNFAEFLLNFDQIFSGFCQNATTFRSFPKPSEAFTPHQGIGTSSVGRCMRPDAPFLASSSARPGGRSPRRNRCGSRRGWCWWRTARGRDCQSHRSRSCFQTSSSRSRASQKPYLQTWAIRIIIVIITINKNSF